MSYVLWTWPLVQRVLASCRKVSEEENVTYVNTMNWHLAQGLTLFKGSWQTPTCLGAAKDLIHSFWGLSYLLKWNFNWWHQWVGFYSFIIKKTRGYYLQFLLVVFRLNPKSGMPAAACLKSFIGVLLSPQVMWPSLPRELACLTHSLGLPMQWMYQKGVKVREIPFPYQRFGSLEVFIRGFQRWRTFT
jgi:hypothetical protein